MKVAVIGLGTIGSRHAANLQRLGHEVAAYDPVHHTADVRQTVINESDAVVIASPTTQHYQDLIDSIRNKKPTFVEKPIAATKFECDELHDFITMKNRVFVGNNLRFHSCILKAKEWLGSGRLGKPLWASFTVAQHTIKSPYLRDGVILNWGSHEIDLAMHLLGPAMVACASARTEDGRDDIADCILVHEWGCRSAIHMDYVTSPEQRHFQITGTEGVMRADLVKRAITITDNCRDLSTSFIGRDSFDENYITEMKAWLDRIAGKETLGATGEDGLRTLEACLDVRRLAGLS